jgi:hypothetical protein
VELEQQVDQWTLVDATVRTYYDECRRDITQYEILKDKKGEDMENLGKVNNSLLTKETIYGRCDDNSLLA